MDGSVSRRWPPLVASGVALLLVLVVLPNPLRIPQNNPTATAEYAPVPGKQQDAVGGNFGETGLPTSGGIGSGDTGEGALPGEPIPPPGDPPPRDKQCVGNPPRQTEDPLSPPCVSHFNGDNFGSTWRGVTDNEIKILFYNDLGVEGDLNAPWKPSDESSTHRTSTFGQQTYIYRTVKAFIRYFSARYQTYGRSIRVLGVPSSGLTASCAARQTDADSMVAEHNPFAVVHLGDGAECAFDRLATRYQVFSFGLNSDVKRKVYEGNRPFIWGFFPDQEAESAWSGSFICRKLYENPARFTKDLTLRGKERKFGLILPRNSQRGPQFEELAELLTQRIKSECGMEWDRVREYNAAGANAGATEANSIMIDFKERGITTVVCYCVPVPTEVTVSTMQNAAASVGYFPEWYWDHMSRMFRAIWNKTFSDKNQPGFGVNHHWRNPALRQQYWYQAYLQMEPRTTPNTRFGFDMYHLFLNLFQGIQAAGPLLTPETIERGMFTFHYLNASNPFVPLGGYGPYNSKAVANYNFVDTAMGWWWDPFGTPPGGNRGEGCIRVMRQGLRYYAGEWPEGDGDLFTDDAPCSQDDTEIADANPGDF